MDDWLNQARHLNPLVQDNSLWKESSNMLGSHLSLNMSHHDLSAGLSGEGERNVHAHTHKTHAWLHTVVMQTHPPAARGPRLFTLQVSMDDLIWHRVYVGDGRWARGGSAPMAWTLLWGSQNINKEMNRATGDLEKPLNIHLPSCILNFFFSSHEHLKQHSRMGS